MHAVLRHRTIDAMAVSPPCTSPRRSRRLPGLLISATAALGASVAGVATHSPVVLAADLPLQLQMSAAQFGELNVGNVSDPVFALITNLGPAIGPLTFSESSTPAPYHFSATTCETTLQTGQQCTVSYTYEPLAPGVHGGNAIFNISPTGSVLDGEDFALEVQGTAVTPLVTVINPLDFGQVLVGESSGELTTSFTNVSSSPYGPLNVTTDVAAPFEVANDECSGATLAPDGGTCALTFRYVPSQEGAAQQAATATIGHVNAIDGLQGFPVEMSGEGIVPPPVTTAPPAPTDPATTVPVGPETTGPASTASAATTPPATLPLTVFVGAVLPRTR